MQVNKSKVLLYTMKYAKNGLNATYKISWARQHRGLAWGNSHCWVRLEVFNVPGPMAIDRLRQATNVYMDTQSCMRLAILFHTWTGLLLDMPLVVVPILLLYSAHCQWRETLYPVYTSKFWQLLMCGPPSDATGRLGTDLFVWLFYSLQDVRCVNRWSCQYPDWIRGCPSRWADHPGPLLYHGKLHGGIYILCIV